MTRDGGARSGAVRCAAAAQSAAPIQRPGARRARDQEYMRRAVLARLWELRRDGPGRPTIRNSGRAVSRRGAWSCVGKGAAVADRNRGLRLLDCSHARGLALSALGKRRGCGDGHELPQRSRPWLRAGRGGGCRQAWGRSGAELRGGGVMCGEKAVGPRLKRSARERGAGVWLGSGCHFRDGTPPRPGRDVLPAGLGSRPWGGFRAHAD
jgi:hypothetical protein